MATTLNIGGFVVIVAIANKGHGAVTDKSNNVNWFHMAYEKHLTYIPPSQPPPIVVHDHFLSL